MKKCINRRCNAELEDKFTFCPFCGKSQVEKKKQKQRRANGCGCIYYRKDIKNKPWSAYSTVLGYREHLGSFATKQEAENALITYQLAPSKFYNVSLAELHDKWKSSKAYERLSDSSKSGYKTAWNKLAPLHKSKFKDLRSQDFQTIVDYYEEEHHERGANGELKYINDKGKVTMTVTSKPKMCSGLKYSALNNIKCLASHLYQFAMRDDIVNKNYAEFIELPDKEETNATAFTDTQLEHIRQNVGKIPYCDYVYALCYLNFRVTEFLTLTRDSFKKEKLDTGQTVYYFVGGIKTEAGKDRVVPIHPNILPIIKKCIAKRGKTVFCREDGSPMNKDYFRESCFYPAMDALGFDRTYQPRSCRRTFSTRMSAAGAKGENIAKLMGHTSYEVDVKYYIKQELKTLYDDVTKMA